MNSTNNKKLNAGNLRALQIVAEGMIENSVVDKSDPESITVSTELKTILKSISSSCEKHENTHDSILLKKYDKSNIERLISYKNDWIG